MELNDILNRHPTIKTYATRAKAVAAMDNRSEVSRCLAKAIAYKVVGKNGEAAHWARKLIEALQLAQILKQGE